MLYKQGCLISNSIEITKVPIGTRSRAASINFVTCILVVQGGTRLWFPKSIGYTWQKVKSLIEG